MELTLHPGQSEVFKDQFVDCHIRHNVVAAARGWGKSGLAGASVITACGELMQLDHSVPNKNVVLIAPTYTSVVDIYYDLLMNIFGLSEIALPGTSQDKGRILLPRNVELKLFSAEAIERLRGTGIYYAVGDEIDTWTIRKPVDSWDSVIHGAGRTRWSPEAARRFKAKNSFRSSVISTPKGHKALWDLYNREGLDSEYRSYHYDYSASPYIDPSEVEKLRSTMGKIEFAQEHEASFKDSGATVYHAFDEELNILENNPLVMQALDKLKNNPNEKSKALVGIDFNVGICASVIGYRVGNMLVITADTDGFANTEQLGNTLFAEYGQCNTFPDPTGNSRKTSAPVGTTDFTILAQCGHNVMARASSPGIADSVNAVNRLCCTADGNRRLFVSRKAKKLLTSLLRTQWVGGRPDTAMIDKSLGIEHWSDGLRYMIEYLFPIQAPRASKRGFNF